MKYYTEKEKQLFWFSHRYLKQAWRIVSTLVEFFFRNHTWLRSGLIKMQGK